MNIELSMEADNLLELDKAIVEGMLSANIKKSSAFFVWENHYNEDELPINLFIDLHFIDLHIDGVEASSVSIDISNENESSSIDFSLNDEVRFSENNLYHLLNRLLKCIDFETSFNLLT